ncbi:hypothetical protein NCCP2222_25270 [Sporosarcina sp. NCCP-2222]|uniref:hypothetical protein n=1 Tax=Sporosarcina sp. NCCP-2222 TaxID=2935073 RepID=UPI0020893AAC|nr:hypothetical protein [Sporosarcina sp. NCCP-2222]GKV56580.1 hypothetical protein NCCP2222_25270 [Sporosarcina sp. NCCP-2222]
MDLREKEFVMTDEPCETIHIKELPELDEETKYIAKTEFRTGLSLTIIYFLFVLSVPVMNWFKPDWAFTKLFGGMSASWFLTTIVAMAMAFIIAFVHTKLYERWERKVGTAILATGLAEKKNNEAATPSVENENEKETV